MQKTRLRLDVTRDRRHHWIAALGLAWVLGFGATEAWAQSRAAEDLEAVQTELRELENRLADQERAREAGLAALREAELDAAAASQGLREVRARLAEQQARQRALLQDSNLAQARLDSERDALGRQVRMSYVAGRQEVLKLLLNQESPAELGRMLVYYDYLNRARSARLLRIEEDLETLERLAAETESVAQELGRLERAQEVEVAALENSRDGRRAALETLERDIETSGDEIRRLRDEAERLAELIAELEGVTPLLPPGAEETFESLKGRLTWPVDGSLVNDFGESRAGGELRWNGVVVGAPAGVPVRAVYYGRVAYADWLPGLGLLAVIDHGAGYMSLYGHNEALLKSSGDWVVPGEVISHVGDSGGQIRTGLYFEIRRAGEPIDPGAWMSSELDSER